MNLMRVSVLEVQGLKNIPPHGSFHVAPDPYVTVDVDDQQLLKTPYFTNTRNAKWSEWDGASVTFQYAPSSVIVFSVHDHHTLSRDVLLGTAVFRCNTVTANGRGTEQRLDVQATSEEVICQIFVRVMASEGANPSAAADRRLVVGSPSRSDTPSSPAFRLGARLLDAAYRGDARAVESLLRSGASADFCASDGWRPVHVAAFKGFTSILLLLLSFGANTTLKTDAKEDPLDLTLKQGHDECTRALFHHEAASKQTTSPIKQGQQHGVSRHVVSVGAACAMFTASWTVEEAVDHTLAKCAHAFSARRMDELSLGPGDIVHVLATSTPAGDGWWLASKDGEQGLVPSERLVVIDQNDAHIPLDRTAMQIPDTWTFASLPCYVRVRLSHDGIDMKRASCGDHLHLSWDDATSFDVGNNAATFSLRVRSKKRSLEHCFTFPPGSVAGAWMDEAVRAFHSSWMAVPRRPVSDDWIILDDEAEGFCADGEMALARAETSMIESTMDSHIDTTDGESHNNNATPRVDSRNTSEDWHTGGDSHNTSVDSRSDGIIESSSFPAGGDSHNTSVDSRSDAIIESSSFPPVGALGAVGDGDLRGRCAGPPLTVSGEVECGESSPSRVRVLGDNSVEAERGRRSPRESSGEPSPAQSYKIFLAKLGHWSSYQVVEGFESFAVKFRSRAPMRRSRATQHVLGYIVAATADLMLHPFWARDGFNEKQTARGVRKYILTRVCDRVLVDDESEAEDRQIQRHIEALHFLTAAHLDVEEPPPEVMEVAVRELLAMDEVAAPHCKTAHLIGACAVLYAFAGEEGGADALLPLLILAVIQANPPRLHSNIVYIDDYSLEEDQITEHGYCHTQLWSAVQFICNITVDKLCISSADFDRLYTPV